MSEVFSWLERTFGIMNVTMYAISLFSTLVERLLLFLLCLVALVASILTANLLRSSLLRFLLPVLTSFILFAGLYLIFPFSEYPFPVDGYLFPGDHPFSVALALTFIVAINVWLVERRIGGIGSGRRRSIAAWLPSVAVCVIAVLLLNGWSLRGLARWLHADPAVTRFATGDFNWIEFDAEQSVLFASGHGTDYLLAFNANGLDQAPRKSEETIGWAQSFAFDPKSRELYVLNLETKTLLLLDAATLALKKEYPGLQITPGDVFMSWDRHTDQIYIASEESEDGYPTMAIDRTTGEVVDTMQLTAYNIYQHPTRPLLYMALDEEEELVAYDIASRKFVARFNAKGLHLERMALTPDGSELLVAAPLHSAVLRLNSDTLEWKGRIDTVMGVRTLNVDPVRNLLLTGSLISNMLDVIDLKTGSRVAKYYVGPWLRSIALDVKSGIAYVSSIEGLYQVKYSTQKLKIGERRQPA